VAVAVGLAPRLARADDEGLRFLGDARVGVGTTGGFVGGPSLRFRYGAEFARTKADSTADWLVGSWAGIEASAGLLVGVPEPDEYGAVTLLGLRPWISRRQSHWFLRTEQWSVLGALLPEVGVAFGVRDAPRWYLGWDLGLGGKHLHVVPGVVWLQPGHAELPVYVTLALRVPM
jgi:hypothetical protein